MLTVSEIKRFIDEDLASSIKLKAKEGLRYYEAHHDIEKCRMIYFDNDGVPKEDKYRSNIKISHPFFTELTDQLVSYMLSSEENPVQAKEKAEGLQEHLDLYFDDEFWAEIGDLIKGAHSKGFEYIHAYQSEENRLVFQCADSMGIIEVREKEADDGCKHIIYWYVDRIDKNKKAVKRIQVWSEADIQYFVQVDNGEIIKDDSEPINPRPHIVYIDQKTGQRLYHQFGYIPFWRLDNNKKKFSGLKPIKELIDDYDLHACSLSNNLKDFDTPIHFVTGFQGDNLDELQMNLKTKKVVGADEGGTIDVKTVSIPYEARKEKLEIDEKNIYRFGMGLNTYGLKDSSATTNIAIRSAYSLLDMKAKAMTTRLKRLLKDILKPVLAEINSVNGTDYQLSDVEFVFKPTIMTNDTENIANEKVKADTEQVKVNTILNVAATIGDEECLKLICEQLDLDFNELKKEMDKLRENPDTTDAQSILNAVEPIE